MLRSDARLWPALDPLAEPLGLSIVALGGAMLNGLGRSVGISVTDPVLLIVGGLWQVILGLFLFFRPTRRSAAWGGVAWFALLGEIQLLDAQEGGVMLPGLLMALCLVVAWHEWRHRAPAALRFPRPLHVHGSSTAAVVAYLASLVGVSFLIRWSIGGTAFWLSLPLLALGDLAERGRLRDRTEVLRTMLRYLLVLGIGVSSLWGFVGHYFMSDMVAASVGWPTGSPFQLELAFYHLGFGIVGLMCLWFEDDFWMAVVLPISTFAFGAASVHIIDYARHQNASPGNWGFSMLFGDVVIPAALVILLWLYRRRVEALPSQSRQPVTAHGA